MGDEQQLAKGDAPKFEMLALCELCVLCGEKTPKSLCGLSGFAREKNTSMASANFAFSAVNQSAIRVANKQYESLTQDASLTRDASL